MIIFTYKALYNIKKYPNSYDKMCTKYLKITELAITTNLLNRFLKFWTNELFTAITSHD